MRRPTPRAAFERPSRARSDYRNSFVTGRRYRRGDTHSVGRSDPVARLPGVDHRLVRTRFHRPCNRTSTRLRRPDGVVTPAPPYSFRRSSVRRISTPPTAVRRSVASFHDECNSSTFGSSLPRPEGDVHPPSEPAERYRGRRGRSRVRTTRYTLRTMSAPPRHVGSH